MADPILPDPSSAATPSLTNVFNPEGQLVSVPSDQAQDLTTNGAYSLASPEEVDQHFAQEQFGDPLSQLETLGEHAASSATFGGSTALQRMISPEAAQNALQRTKANPGTAFTGDIAGLLGSSVAGVGEGAVLNAAGDTVKAALGLSGEGLGLGARVLGGAAEGAVQGGGFQAGDEISKMMSSADQSLGSALTHIGLYGMLGGGALGGAIGSVTPLWNATIGDRLGQGIEDFKGRIKERANVPDPVSTLTEELTNRVNSSKAIFDEVYGPQGLKEDAIKNLMPQQLSEEMVGQARDVLQKANHFTQAMNIEPDLYPRGLSALFNKNVRILSDTLSEPTSSQEVFSAIQDFKQRLQSSVDYGWQGVPKEQQEFVNGVKNIAFDVRKGLENPEVWGKAGEVQQELNQGFSEYQTPLKQFRQKFMTKVGDDFQIDPQKAQTYINQTGKAGQKIKQEMLGNFLEADQAYRNKVNSVYAKAGADSPFAPSSIQFAQSTLKDLPAGAKLADAVINKGITNLTSGALGTGIGGAVGHSVGMGGFGALIGEHTLAPFFKSILPFLFKPLMESANSPGGLKSAVDYGMSVIKGDSLIKKGAKAIFDSSREVLPSTFIPDQKKIDQLDKKLSEYQVDPSKMMNPAGKLADYLPNHQIGLSKMTASSVNTLNAMRPTSNKQSPLDAEPPIPKSQQVSYERALSMAEQPLLAFKHIQDGTLQPQDLQVLNAVSPALHQKMIAHLQEEMMNHLSEGGSIPYKTRLGLSLFTGQPLDSTLTPQGIRAAQNTFQQNVSPTQPSPGARGGRAHSMKALQNAGELDQTPSQERQSFHARKA